MYCPICHEPIHPGEYRCPKCGEPVPLPEPETR